MRTVVDANIAISLLITPSNTIDLFFDENIELAAPEFIMQEIDKHKKDIMQKSGLDATELDGFLDIIRKRISIYHETNLLQYRKLAKEICPDINDMPYFALALKLQCPIWSNDKKLKEQNNVKVLNTEEIRKVLKKN